MSLTQQTSTVSTYMIQKLREWDINEPAKHPALSRSNCRFVNGFSNQALSLLLTNGSSANSTNYSLMEEIQYNLVPNSYNNCLTVMNPFNVLELIYDRFNTITKLANYFWGIKSLHNDMINRLRDFEYGISRVLGRDDIKYIETTDLKHKLYEHNEIYRQLAEICDELDNDDDSHLPDISVLYNEYITRITEEEEEDELAENNANIATNITSNVDMTSNVVHNNNDVINAQHTHYSHAIESNTYSNTYSDTDSDGW